MAHSFWEMKTGTTLQIDFAGVIPGLLNGEGIVKLILRHKKGRSARFEIVADENVYIDLHPRNDVKQSGEQIDN